MSEARLLSELLDKLQILFEIFLNYNISIKPTKSDLNYPDIMLLGQWVKLLGLTTPEKKLRAIQHLTYPNTLRDLEYYIGLTGYPRNYIHFYAQIAIPLQALRTSLLGKALLSSQQRKAYASKTRFCTLTPQELALFLSIKKTLTQPSTLIHHNFEKTLWIDLDASKNFVFGAIVFHTTSNEVISEGSWPSVFKIQPMLFFYRLLIPVKRNYWLTKLEILDFVWVVINGRHIITLSEAGVII